MRSAVVAIALGLLGLLALAACEQGVKGSAAETPKQQGTNTEASNDSDSDVGLEGRKYTKTHKKTGSDKHSKHKYPDTHKPPSPGKQDAKHQPPKYPSPEADAPYYPPPGPNNAYPAPDNAYPAPDNAYPAPDNAYPAPGDSYKWWRKHDAEQKHEYKTGGGYREHQEPWGEYAPPREAYGPKDDYGYGGMHDEGPYYAPREAYGTHRPSYPPPVPPQYFGYDAVCVGDAEYVTGNLTWSSTIGNLEAATASCPAAGNTLQIGGYCTVECRNITVDPPRPITELGASTGWYSDDTRNATGATLIGNVSTYPPGTGTVADDAAIAQQINFTTYPDGAGLTGVMRLWATNDNRGKASVRFYQPWTGTFTPITSGSALATITTTFRWYMEPASTSRTPAFNMLVLGANNGVFYSLSWLLNSGNPNAWNTFSLNANTNGWRIYCSTPPGCPGNDEVFNMTSLLADSRFGVQLSGGQVLGVGFNLGSSQRQCYVGIDWLETSLLNGGARIDFGPVEPPPEPQYPRVAMGGAVIGGATGQNVAPSNGWMWGVGLPGVPAKTSCFGPSISADGVNAECANVAVAVCCRPRPSTT